MSNYLTSFDDEEMPKVESELTKLVKSLQGRKLEEGDWTALYCAVKGVADQGWSNLPFRDYLHDGKGIEFKLLSKSEPSAWIGKSLMHPAATRTITFDSESDANVAMRTVLQQWSAAISTFEQRIRATSQSGSVDARWGILLWASDHSEFLYFEERLEKPDHRNFEARWHEGNHRGNPTRNLHIYEKNTGKKRFSCTLPKNGAKLQPYFDIPSEADGAHIFRPNIGNSVPLFVNKPDAEMIEQLFPNCETEEAIARLLRNWRDTNGN